MKKFIALLASVVIALSLFSFAACTKNGVGVVPGNYAEASEEQIEEAVEKIDTEKPFGDVTASDYKLGLEFAADMAVAFDVPELASMNASFSAGYKFTAAKEKGEFVLAGSGEGKLNAKSSTKTTTGTTTDEVNFAAKLYNDSNFVYMDLDGEQAVKGKVGIEAALDFIGDEIGGVIGQIGGSVGGDFDFAAMVEELDAMGIKTYLDVSSGVKIKFSVTEESVDKIIEMVIAQMNTFATAPEMGYAGYVKEVLDTLEFSAMKLDLYLAFDGDGKFAQVGLDADIAFTVDATKLGAGVITASMKGGVTLKTFAGTVTLPEGLADDKEYQDLTNAL